jgi:hypothetical protein
MKSVHSEVCHTKRKINVGRSFEEETLGMERQMKRLSYKML